MVEKVFPHPVSQTRREKAVLEFNDEEQQFRQEVRRFAHRRLIPNARQWDEGAPMTPDILKELTGLGLSGLRVPQEYGGTEASFTMMGIAAEEIGRGDTSVGSYVSLPAMLAETLRAGNNDLQKHWYPRIAEGKVIAAFALTEPEAGSDAASLRTRAKRDGDDWVIDGEKSSITFAGNADVSVVFARTGGPGARGVSTFIVPLNVEGVGREVYDTPGERLTQRGAIRFDGVRVPGDHLVGAEGEGFVRAMSNFDYSRTITSLLYVGAAYQSLDETIAYVKQRQAFGVPVAKFEGVSFKIAEHYVRMEAARLLCYQALRRKDRGLPHSKDTAVAKIMSMEAAFDTVHACVLLHGHYGYNKALPLEMRLRNILGLEIGAGTYEALKLTIIRELMGKEAMPYK